MKNEPTDSEMLDWLEKQAKESHTGISFDWCKYVEEGQVLEHGYRFMRYHHLGERKKTIREVILSEMRSTEEQP